MKRGVILDEDELREAVDYFLTKDKFSFDVEAQGEHRSIPHLANLSWMSLATYGAAIVIPFGHPIGTRIIGERQEPHQYKTGKKAGETYYKSVPVYEDPPAQIPISSVFGILRPLFWKPGIITTGHGIIYDLVSTGKYWGEVPPPPYNCTLVKKWLLNENLLRKDLKTLTRETIGLDYDEEGIGKRVESFPFAKVAYYSWCDSVADFILDQQLDPQVDAEGLREVFNLEMDVLNVLLGMRLHGARLDIPRLHELKDILTLKVQEAEASVYKAAGRKFNVNSAQQKQKVLYGPRSEGGQGLSPWKMTQAGEKKSQAGHSPLSIDQYSTDASVLASYPGNPVAAAILDYQDVSKLLNTYVIGWLGDGEEKPCIIHDEHIHADFVQYGTVTGRFSCREPNLQNIPRPYTELGQLLRGVFIPEPGGKLVVADYSQIELVVLAHYLGQGKLFEGFLQGIDPHTMTAAMVLGKNPSDITKVERQDLGKTLGFAVVYGAGLAKVASMAKVSVPRAREILAKHKRMFPEIHDYKDSVIREARHKNPPHLVTLMGRKRRINGLLSADEGTRMGAERQAFNSLIQGGAADLMKYSMVRVDAMLPPGVHLTMTVHDELILASPEHMAQEAASILREAMTGPEIQALVKVPLNVDVHVVDRWCDAK